MKSNPELLDRCWSWLAMALVGEELDERDEICGAGTLALQFLVTSRDGSYCSSVVSLRTKLDRIQLWTRSKDDVERINSIGKRVVKLLDVATEPGIGFEFQVIRLHFSVLVNYAHQFDSITLAIDLPARDSSPSRQPRLVSTVRPRHRGVYTDQHCSAGGVRLEGWVMLSRRVRLLIRKSTLSSCLVWCGFTVMSARFAGACLVPSTCGCNFLACSECCRSALFNGPSRLK